VWRSIRPQAAGIIFSGSFGYSIGGGQAVLKADTVTNPNASASGPLRFSLWFTPAAYPSAGYSTASYDITPSLAANSSINGVNAGNTGVPFTDPPTGCYYVSLVLEENVSGTSTSRDYGTFPQLRHRECLHYSVHGQPDHRAFGFAVNVIVKPRLPLRKEHAPTIINK
jgi:hypothetical protein